MFGKKKPAPAKGADKASKPNKIKIDLAFDRCRESIQTLLDQYQAQIDSLVAKMVSLKKEKRLVELDRYKERLKLVLGRQAKMQNLMDQVDNFSSMVDQAFAQTEVYGALRTVLTETNKIDVTPEIRGMLKQMSEFDDIFSKGLNQMDAVFGRVTSKISDIDTATAATTDAEIDSLVDARLSNLDEATTMEAEEDEGLFDLK